MGADLDDLPSSGRPVVVGERAKVPRVDGVQKVPRSARVRVLLLSGLGRAGA